MLVQTVIASPSPTAAATPLITLERVTKTYGAGQAAVPALRGIDLDVTQGEFLAVMGPSGSGKSTAMNILGCLDVPTGGTYRFRGVDVGSLTRNQRALLQRPRERCSMSSSTSSCRKRFAPAL